MDLGSGYGFGLGWMDFLSTAFGVIGFLSLGVSVMGGLLGLQFSFLLFSQLYLYMPWDISTNHDAFSRGCLPRSSVRCLPLPPLASLFLSLSFSILIFLLPL